jgi:gliding motility-associated lipoprotein GldJ
LLESEVYAWEGKSLRNQKGQFMANFKRGRGDYAGWRGGDGKHMSDGYMITAPIYEFAPNDFGLYNMSGNVAEWTLDTYRTLSYEDVDDLNPYRRKGKTEIRPDNWLDDISYKEKESLLFNPSQQPGQSSTTNTPFDNVKVYRGGSWADLAYYLSPGSRRFFNADSSSATIGFRCAMIRVGSPD